MRKSSLSSFLDRLRRMIADRVRRRQDHPMQEVLQGAATAFAVKVLLAWEVAWCQSKDLNLFRKK